MTHPHYEPKDERSFSVSPFSSLYKSFKINNSFEEHILDSELKITCRKIAQSQYVQHNVNMTIPFLTSAPIGQSGFSCVFSVFHLISLFPVLSPPLNNNHRYPPTHIQLSSFPRIFFLLSLLLPKITSRSVILAFPFFLFADTATPPLQFYSVLTTCLLHKLLCMDRSGMLINEKAVIIISFFF